jgi:hypothetical protein
VVTGERAAGAVDEHAARAADQAIVRAQTLAMMLTGQPLAPRLEVAVAPPGPNAERDVLQSSPSRAGVLGMPGAGRPRRDAVRDRGFWVSVLIPLIVFVGLLVAMGAMRGDGTRALLAMGAIAVGILVAVLPSLLRGGRPEMDPQETKDVLDVMAGALIALRGEAEPSGSRAASGAGEGAAR